MTAAVLLAAGEGSRFDGDTPKLLAPLRGRTVLEHALDAVCGSGLDVYVVTGAADVDDVLPDGVTVVHNESWDDGQAVSVRAGITAASRDGHDAVVVGLGDQPFVTAAAWRAVADAAAPIAVATYEGERGNPVRLAAEVWDLLPAFGDEVGRAVIRSRPDLVRPVPCAGDATDIDTLEDLHRWS
ncbi:MAG: nucleotidyltransferase family protein [Acidimicrobiales bacterium]|nr:nucleotidyltransferase family protein [Acidimicrobiales bacterium]